MIDQLVAALGQELGLTSKEIADTVWLALQMESSGLSAATARKATSGEADTRSSRGQSVNRAPTTDLDLEPEQPSQEAQPAAELHTPNSQSENGDGLGSELMLKVPNARSLREPLSLARSLKPLLQKVTAGWSTKLDEAATVERIAGEGIWMPVLQPALEPWLDLALVVDENISMHLWQHTLTELQRLFANYGVFRDVRVWSLVTDDEGQVKLRPRLGAAARRQILHRPSELIDAGGRRLILIATDCVSAIWQDGTVLPALKLWATSGPMAIVQMLPEWLWARTGLGFAAAVRLHALMPGVPNQRLDVRDLSPWDEVDLETGVRVPVVTLEPEPFWAWAKMVSVKEGASAPGFVFEPEAVVSTGTIQPLDASSEDSAEQRVQRFRATASPMARRLAGLLAAAPVISLPVVRIIRDRLLPQSRQINVAEVFLGGLLKPISTIEPDVDFDLVQYDFMSSIRELLLESVPTDDSVNVLEEVSRFIAEHLGLSLASFAAILMSPGHIQENRATGWSHPFATITAQILRTLGGSHARLAEELEPGYQSSLETEQENQDSDFPVNKTFPESINSKTADRTPLLRWDNTQLYTLQTSVPWTLPFDALVVPVGSGGTLGGLGDDFEQYLISISEHRSKILSRLIFERMEEVSQEFIEPHQPLLVSLPSEFKRYSQTITTSEKSIFIICATVELGGRLINSENAAMAIESILRLASEEGLKKIIFPLLGTGRNRLPIEQIAVATLKAVDQAMESMASHGIEELTIVGKEEETIEIVNRVAFQLDEYEFLPIGSGREEFDIRQVEEVIKLTFGHLIDMQDLRSKVQTDLIFLSRGLAAYSLCNLANIDANIAANTIVDGIQDNGIDALYFDERRNSLWLVQAKWNQKRKEKRQSSYVKILKDGVLALLAQRFHSFNDKIRSKEEEVLLALNSPGLEVRIVLAYADIHLQKRSREILDNLIEEINDFAYVASYELFSLASCIESLRNGFNHSSNNFSSSKLNNSSSDLPSLSDIEFEIPGGQVDLASPYYVERPPIEANCYETILEPGALIRIKAPRQMGKTSLVSRILHQAAKHGYITVPLSFQLADAAIFADLDKFSRWFCASVGRRLRLSNKLSDYWDEIFGTKDNCTLYFEEYLLPEIKAPLVLGLDEVDIVFEHPNIAADFMGLLRVWHELAKNRDLWKKLRLVVAHSTEVYMPLYVNQSPFNVGLSIELPEFTLGQVLYLAQRHRLLWEEATVKQLMAMVGGHPYLVRVALYQIARQEITLNELLAIAPTETGPYGDHLRRHWWNLEQRPEMAEAMQRVVTSASPVRLEPLQAFQLHSMGIVHLLGNEAVPQCDLYRVYFKSRLNDFPHAT